MNLEVSMHHTESTNHGLIELRNGVLNGLVKQRAKLVWQDILDNPIRSGKVLIPKGFKRINPDTFQPQLAEDQAHIATLDGERFDELTLASGIYLPQLERREWVINGKYIVAEKVA